MIFWNFLVKVSKRKEKVAFRRPNIPRGEGGKGCHSERYSP